MSGFGVIPKGGAAGVPKSAAGIKAKAKANPQLVVGGAAVAIVVAVALMSKKGTGADGEPGIGAAAATAAGGQLTPNQGGYYDSTANDVYQSLMGQFVTLQEQVASLSEGPSTPTPIPTPAPTPTPVVVPKPVAKPAAKAAAKPAAKAAAKPAAKAPAPKIYTVKAGDNLTAISRRLYGSSDWHRLYNANVGVIGRNPNLIKPGQKLRY